MTSYERFRAAAAERVPKVAIVLGSGLGRVLADVRDAAAVPFAAIPGLAAPGAAGHAGLLVQGQWAGREVLICRGRLHRYEGHSWDRIARLVEVLAECGAATLLLTNASGGIHERLLPGELMVLTGHLALQQPESWRTLEMARPYDAALVDQLIGLERQQNRELFAGVYAAMTGPSYETPAEIQALRSLGADAVGMSTAFEAETAVRLGLRVAAVACITNRAAGLSPATLDHGDVLVQSGRLADRLGTLIDGFIRAGPDIK